jgi:hypothetical protein
MRMLQSRLCVRRDETADFEAAAPLGTEELALTVASWCGFMLTPGGAPIILISRSMLVAVAV